MKSLQDKIDTALNVAFRYAQFDGSHHKMWVIDQMVRELLGEEYEQWVAKYEYDEENDEHYEWDPGIPP